MRLPAVALVAAFAGGSLLGLSQVIPARAALYPYPAIIAACVLVLIAIGFVLTYRGWLWPAAAVSLRLLDRAGVHGCSDYAAAAACRARALTPSCTTVATSHPFALARDATRRTGSFAVGLPN